MKTILLVGCGNIGFRHLQAMAQLSEPSRICIVEPAIGLHPRISDFLATAASGPHQFELATTPESVPARVDLAVIATNAAHRRAAYQAAAQGRDIACVIFEKVLFPTIADIEAVAASLTTRKTSAYVNCGRRGFPGYQALRTQWADARPLNLTVTGAQWGLGSNAIHFLDLAEYLNGAALTDVDLSGLEPGAVASKREGYVEIFGNVTGHLSNGATVSLDCLSAGSASVHVAVQGRNLNARIDETGRQLLIDGAEPVAFEARHVSEMPYIYEAALDGTCCLTPYADSARQHRVFLMALRPHLGLSNDDDAPCPIS